MKLTAVKLSDPVGFWEEVRHRWSLGEAVLPLNPNLPAAATEGVLTRMTPSSLIDEESRRGLPGGTSVEEGTAAVLLTSGSTGAPKGVVIGHSALEASVSLTHQRLAARQGDRWLCCLPVHHVAGFMTLVRSLSLGFEPEIHAGFDPQQVASSEASFVSLVPTMLIRLLDQGIDLSGFKAILLGGAQIPPGLVRRAKSAGANVLRTYGMTETCGGVIYDGAPLTGVELRTTDEGLIEIASPTLMTGYRNDPQLTSESLGTRWFRTSDIGSWDGHILEVHGRSDDMIVTGGEKIAPLAIEQRLARHPAVADVTVIGMPDAEWGSAVAAFVVLVPNAEAPSLQAWRSFVREDLPPHAAPKRVHVVESIPRTASGKLDRAGLLQPFRSTKATKIDGFVDEKLP